jgi:hypothetical protein
MMPDAAAQNLVVDATPSHVANTFSPIKALGGTVDRLSNGVADATMTEPILSQILSAGWQTITYRQNTELFAEAWHWNPEGTWSDSTGQGYFTGNPNPTQEVRHSYGYALPHLGTSRNSRGGGFYYSRLTDGDEASYWKSNPYLTKGFTGDEDSAHPQWVLIDLGSMQPVNAIRIAWAQPYATDYAVQFWTGGDSNPRAATTGLWQAFPAGRIRNSKGGTVTLALTRFQVQTRYIRVFMTASSNTCDTHGSSDKRNCVGYAVSELYIGTQGADSSFHDLVKHAKTGDQTRTIASSMDPWHRAADLNEAAGEHVGFDFFFKSGITRGLPTMVPTAMLYGQPEDSAAQIAWLEKRGYPISYVEIGEEPDGQRAMPEDCAALFVQWARAIHKVDPKVKLGGPVFEGVNEDIKVWPDADGRVSWFGRFVDYLKDHNAMSEFAFMSYEHYPYRPCGSTWDDLYREPQLITHIMDVWNDDGLPASTPQLMTEGNMSSRASGTFVDVSGGLWLADYVGSFLTHGGTATYFFHTIPNPLGAGCGDNMGAAMALINMGRDRKPRGFLSQYWGSILINKEWVQLVDKDHKVFPVTSYVRDSQNRTVVTAYAVERPDGTWALMIINKDRDSPQAVRIAFHDGASNADRFFTGPVRVVNWGAAQYVWHPAGADSYADPNEPPVAASTTAAPDTTFTLPKGSVTVIQGKIAGR